MPDYAECSNSLADEQSDMRLGTLLAGTLAVAAEQLPTSGRVRCESRFSIGLLFYGVSFKRAIDSSPMLISLWRHASHPRNRRSRRSRCAAEKRSLDDFARDARADSVWHRDWHSLRPCRDSAYRQHALRTFSKRLVHDRNRVSFASHRCFLCRLLARSQSFLH
jgi:hypothetical protein